MSIGEDAAITIQVQNSGFVTREVRITSQDPYLVPDVSTLVLNPGDRRNVSLTCDARRLGAFASVMGFPVVGNASLSDELVFTGNVELAGAAGFPVAAYIAWQDLCMPGKKRGTGIYEDYDGDGLANVWEFLFASDPGAASSAAGLRIEWMASDRTCLEYHVRNDVPSALLQLEETTDLRRWEPVDIAGASVRSDDNGDGTSTVTIEIPTTGEPARFFRLDFRP